LSSAANLVDSLGLRKQPLKRHSP